MRPQRQTIYISMVEKSKKILPTLEHYDPFYLQSYKKQRKYMEEGLENCGNSIVMYMLIGNVQSKCTYMVH